MSVQAIKDKKNKIASAGAGGIGGSSSSSGIDRSIENLSTIANLAKKSKSIKLKNSGLPNLKANSRANYLTFEAKKAFIHLRKAFTKAPIFKYFDPKHYI